MSERWKYQIKSGGFYALAMTLLMTLWDCYALSFDEAVFSIRFVVRLVFFLVTGIFLIGYFNWKAKVKSKTTK